MGVITLVYLTLALPVVTLCYPDQWLHKIYVDNQTGVNDSYCWEEGYSVPCFSLNLALTGAQHYKNSTIVILQPGQHQLHSGSETQLSNMSQLAIVGNGSQGEVVIRCEPLAGLAFFWSQDIELRNVSLANCGAIQNSTSINIPVYNEPVSFSFLRILVGIFFLNCKAIQLTSIHVAMSTGAGSVIYNPVGVVKITSCLFSYNGVSGEQDIQYGGGGLVIEGNDITSQSSCIITNSTFTHNTASMQILPLNIKPSEQSVLGKGGGISIVFRGGAINNAVQLNIVTLENNTAQYGGGFFVYFGDNAAGNTVTIDGAEVIGNEVSPYLFTCKGGGALIAIDAYYESKPTNNTITITSSKFIDNEADTGGGGIAVDLDCNYYWCPYAGNKLLIENCLFQNNNAFQGSSVLLSQSGTCIPSLLDTTLSCGSALPGYGVPFNWPTFGCIECTEWYGWAIFIFLQLVPLWIMMIILAVLHINITNGGLNGYILYSQLVSLQFPGLGYSSWVPAVVRQVDGNMQYIPLIVYSIWNLNFLTLYPIQFCLPLVDTAAGVILLQYVIAACPLVFIIVTYTWIRWYNNGYKFVVYTTRPVHQLLVCFWQKLKICPSLIDTYVGLMLLSYMKFLTISVKLLQYIFAIELQVEASINITLEHVVLGIVAVLCLLVFVVPPMVVLLFYHLKIFQQCLTWCKLDRPGLHALVDAYRGCFKNSATDGLERRYFAGLYLLFRFCYLLLIVLPSSIHAMYYNDNNFNYNDGNCDNTLIGLGIQYIPLSVSEACLSFAMAGLVVLMRPYKKIAHNVIDFLIFFFLIVIGAPSFMRLVTIILTSFPIYLPFLFLTFYLIFRLLKYCCCACVALRRGNVRQVICDNEANTSSPTERQPLLKPPSTSVVTLNDCDKDDGYADISQQIQHTAS